MTNWSARYRLALIIAILIHFSIGFLLMFEPNSARPVILEETKNEVGENTPQDQDLAKKPEIVHAVSVDAAAVNETIERLKNAKAQAQKQEQAHQAALKQELALAKQARVAEQQRLAAMKIEEEKIAIARKKAIEEEKKHLKHLAEQKAKEIKELEALKAKQTIVKKQKEMELKQEREKKKEIEKQLALNKQQDQQQKNEDEAKHTRETQDKARAAEQAAIDAARRAKLAGVVDKYKAMILNAISQQWILPEQVAPGLSSQFRIRLAPNGTVLEVSLLRSSGDPILDRSAQTAIYKASPLPVPADAESFDVFREISLTVRPEQMRG
jgi:colicin import membrane protein